MTHSRFSPAHVRDVLVAAASRRAGVAGLTDAYRWVDDQADGLPGLVIDRYGDFAVLSVLGEPSARAEDAIAASLMERGCAGVYLKRRPRTDLRRENVEALSPREPLLGARAPHDLVVREYNLRIRVELAAGLSTGLFADQRDNRRCLRAIVSGKRVLNLFAYTCAFTVAAALGGAANTTSVDLSQRSLTRGNENLALNGVSGPAHRLLKADVLSFLARASRRGEQFDVVVLDPPSFGTHAGGTFSVEREYEIALERCFALLAPGGRLLAVTNHRKTSRARFASMLRRAAHEKRRELVEFVELAMPADFPHRPFGEEPTKSALLTVG